MNALQAYVDENLYELDKGDIEWLCKMNNDLIIKNVIVGRRTHCYGLMLIDDQKSIDYQLFYLNGKRDLRGFLLKMTLHHPGLHAVLLQFCKYLTESFDLDVFAVYTTIQEKISIPKALCERNARNRANLNTTVYLSCKTISYLVA